MRLFIAVPCRPGAALRRLLAALGEHRPWLRPVAAEQLHVTLRFLGPTPASQVPAICVAVDRAVQRAGVTATPLPLTGLAGMPAGGRRPPRVLHASFGDAAVLHALAGALDRKLAELDPPIPPPARPFHAHLTLARLKLPDARRRGRRRRAAERPPVAASQAVIRDLLERHAHADLGVLTADAVHLLASQLTPAGPIHRCLHATPLPAARDHEP